jgi:PIN domain nuclease of toxin-antitoxin system
MATDSETERYVLDACALIAYLNDEAGAEIVADLIEQSRQNFLQLYVASVNLYEVFYDGLRRDEASARQLLNDLYSLPVTIIETLDRPLMHLAGRLKVSYRISLADSIALALAQQLRARLISSDHHEIDPIEKAGDVKMKWIR